MTARVLLRLSEAGEGNPRMPAGCNQSERSLLSHPHFIQAEDH